MIAIAMAAVMGLSVSAFAAEETTSAKAETEVQTEDNSEKKTAKSEHLVAEEFKDIVTNEEGLLTAGLEYLAAGMLAGLVVVAEQTREELVNNGFIDHICVCVFLW